MDLQESAVLDVTQSPSRIEAIQRAVDQGASLSEEDARFLLEETARQRYIAGRYASDARKLKGIAETYVATHGNDLVTERDRYLFGL